jgi:hypothetical protein
MKTPENDIILNSDKKSVWVNGLMTPFNDVAVISDTGHLMIKLTWMTDYMGTVYTYNDELKRVDIFHTNQPYTINNPNTNQSNPVAVFTFAKPTYQIGEPVKYIDLSYSPDAEGIAKFEWKGKQEVFFEPGTYPISLTVWDRFGNKSEIYKRNIVITDKVFLSKLDYPFYINPPGTFIDPDPLSGENLRELPELPRTTSADLTRTLLVSASPQEVTQRGILYQDKVNGKARLYADHINGTKDKLTLAILATNLKDKPVMIKTTNKGEVGPSVGCGAKP